MSEEPENLNEFGLNVSSAQIDWRWADEEKSTMSYDEQAQNSWQFDAEEGMSFRIVFWKQAFIYFNSRYRQIFLSKILAYQIYC